MANKLKMTKTHKFMPKHGALEEKLSSVTSHKLDRITAKMAKAVKGRKKK